MVQDLKKEIDNIPQAARNSASLINRRRHVRVYYPVDVPQKFLPELLVNQFNCQVLDISEGGIRFAAPNASLIKNCKVYASLRFTDGEEIEITGMVVRRERNQIALMLEKGIPYCRIMSEQLRLRNLEINGVFSSTEKTRQP